MQICCVPVRSFQKMHKFYLLFSFLCLDHGVIHYILVSSYIHLYNVHVTVCTTSQRYFIVERMVQTSIPIVFLVALQMKRLLISQKCTAISALVYIVRIPGKQGSLLEADLQVNLQLYS